jgi:hypothetical protein
LTSPPSFHQTQQLQSSIKLPSCTPLLPVNKVKFTTAGIGCGIKLVMFSRMHDHHQAYQR